MSIILTGESVIEMTVEEDTHPLLDSEDLKPSTGRVCWYVYVSHFLSAWGDRMWQFGVGLFLVIISPDSLRVTAVYGLSMGASVLLLGAHVGNWVDRTARLTAARTSLVLQTVSVVLCAGVVFVVITWKSEIQEAWPRDGLLTLAYGVIIVIAIVANLASTANTIVVERDWIVVICGKDKNLLASTGATLKAIDLVTNIVAPIVTGQVMTYGSPGIGALFIAGWNLLSVGLEYYLLWKVYDTVPGLRQAKVKGRTGEARSSLEYTNSYVAIKDDTNILPDKNPEKEPSRFKKLLKRLLSGLQVFTRGWRTYMQYKVAYAGLALASLYMTVLGFDNVTVGFAYTQGINESIMGIIMAAGAATGIMGTAVFPRIRKKIGVVRTGLFGIFFIIAFLSLSVASVWSPGSPFDPYYWSRDFAEILANSSKAETFTSMSNVFSLDNRSSTEIPSQAPYELQNVENTSLLQISFDRNISGVNSVDIDPGVVAGIQDRSYLSIGLLLAGIVGARFGLWISDLTITQLFLGEIVESERGIVLGVQTSLNQLMDMLKFFLVIAMPEPEVFGYLILISFAFICIGWCFYARFSFTVRGHILPFHALKPEERKPLRL